MNSPDQNSQTLTKVTMLLSSFKKHDIFHEKAKITQFGAKP